MPSSLFYPVLNMSLAACFVIAALLAVRQIRPLPRRVVYPLWSLALLRLCIPVALSSRFSLFNFTGGLVKRLVTVETLTQGTVALPPGAAMMNMIGAAQSYLPVTYKTETLRQGFVLATGVWAGVAGAMLLAACALYFFTRRTLRAAAPLGGGLYRSELLRSPVLVGVLRPKLYLPPGLDPESPEGRMVLAHEAVHRRRGDNFWRLLAVFLVCVHWFNPLAWVMLRAFLDDMERACDEAVLRRGGDCAETRRTYAAALLRFAEGRGLHGASAFGGSAAKVRILHILHYRRLTAFGAVAAALLLLVLTLILATNPI